MPATRYVFTAEETLFNNWPTSFRYLLPAKHFYILDQSYSTSTLHSQGNYSYFSSP